MLHVTNLISITVSGFSATSTISVVSRHSGPLEPVPTSGNKVPPTKASQPHPLLDPYPGAAPQIRYNVLSVHTSQPCHDLFAGVRIIHPAPSTPSCI